MPASLLPSFLSKSAPKDAIPYSSEAIRQDLVRVRVAWEGAQSSRDRDAIYGYLTAVYGLVGWWTAEGQEIDRAHRALRLQRLKPSDREDPFAAVIRCTADPAKADKRRQTDQKQVVARDAVRGHLQVGFRAPRSVHQAEGWDQRMRGPVPGPTLSSHFHGDVCAVHSLRPSLDKIEARDLRAG